MMANIVLVTDAWQPQVNGVVRTLNKVTDGLRERGHCLTVISPLDFRSVPCPTYPEIRLALTTRRAVMQHLEKAQPSHIHIATEGPLGILARSCCRARGWPFTTSFHTRFPEYLRERLPVPKRLTYFLLRRFHNSAQACLVPTPSIQKELLNRGFSKTRLWTRGVDREQFNVGRAIELGLPKPIFLCVGRVAPEKNLAAFLSLDLPGTKLVVGDGPMLEKLKVQYPHAVFMGQRTGLALAEIFASADVFVFPSRTDTFGLVLLEAIASGLPVAAYPVPGPIDVICPGKSGVLSEDLRQAALDALTIGKIDPDACLADFTWENCVDIFVDILTPLTSSSSLKEAMAV
jgi:glycosyltransferase involved in cell wall biosynthesis